MKIEEKDGAVIIRLEDDVMFEQAEAFEAAVESALERGAPCMIMDFAGIDYLASQCLKTISVAVGRLREKGGELVIVNPTERIRQLCRITRLDFVVPLLADETEAFARAHAARDGAPQPSEPEGGA